MLELLGLSPPYPGDFMSQPDNHQHGLKDLPIGTGPGNLLPANQVLALVNSRILFSDGQRGVGTSTPTGSVSFFPIGTSVITVPMNTVPPTTLGSPVAFRAGFNLQLADVSTPIQVRMKLGGVVLGTYAFTVTSGAMFMELHGAWDGDDDITITGMVVAPVVGGTQTKTSQLASIVAVDASHPLTVEWSWDAGADTEDSVDLQNLAVQILAGHAAP